MTADAQNTGGELTMSITRRSFLRDLAAASGAAGLAALTAACDSSPSDPTVPAAGQASSRPSRTFKIAYLTLGWAGIEVIHQLGLLEQRGWSVEWRAVDTISGVANAFAAGQLDLIDMSAIIAAQMYEQDVKVAVFGAGVGSLGSIVVGKSSTVQSVPELRGRTVAGVPGSTTSQDLNALSRKVHGLDLFEDTRFVQASAPPDIANLLVKSDVEAALTWEPTTTQLTQSGMGRVVATQQHLWEQATGATDTEVHVVYVTTPAIAEEHATLLRDVNAAQAEVAELWKQGDARAVEAMMKVTRLPEEVVKEALARTTPLSGLSARSIDTMIQQIQLNRQHGTILQSDIWNQDPAKVRRELFVQVD
jgi:ABC-type nitrate/sulfonate/bicarbonate transport system substrate-binding protein